TRFRLWPARPLQCERSQWRDQRPRGPVAARCVGPLPRRLPMSAFPLLATSGVAASTTIPAVLPITAGGAEFWLYGGFVAIVLVFLALDLGVFHRHAHVVGMREALGWTAIWVSTALLFSVAVYFMYEARFLGLGLDVPVLGRPGQTETLGAFQAWKLFVTGYLVEES